MKLYFVRHGESEANRLQEFSNSGVKHPLTEQGLAQARQLAGDLCGLAVEKVYTSPVLRAIQTAQIIARGFNAPVEATEALREWSVGIYEGTRVQPGWGLHRQVQEDWFIHGKLDSRMPGGESFLDIRARFMPFIESLLSERGNSDRQIVLVAHGGIYLAMLPVVLKNVDHAFAMQHMIPYTGCVIADAKEDGLWCRSWCGQELF